MMIALFFGALGGIAGTYTFMNVVKPSFSQEQLIAEYYATETATSVSPTELKSRMDKGDTNFIVVDLRNEGAYNAGHVAGAVNVPNTEASSVLAAKEGGTVIFFSMATQFAQASLATDATGKDVNLIIASGIAKGEDKEIFQLLKEHPDLFGDLKAPC